VRVTIISLISVAIIWSMPAFAADQGDAAPAWQAVNMQGETVSFPEMAEGRPAVLIFWATWCPYCKAFMPYLKRIHEDYGSEHILIVAVNAKDKDGDKDAYVDALGFPVVAIRDGDEIAVENGVRFIPGLMVVDGNGTVSYRRRSTELPPGKAIAQLWSEQVREALDQALE
jgi:thiol-disulfide isomerase/thioredoxin